MNSACDLRKSLGRHSRLPPNKSFVTLSHAISWIAFRRSTAGPVLSRLAGIGKLPCHDRAIQNELLDRAIKSAVERLTDLGLGGTIGILGKRYAHVLDDDRDDKISTEQIPTERMADYRGFDLLDDTLFPAPYREVVIAWGMDRMDVYSPIEKHYRFVLVNRNDLMREFPDEVGKLAEPQPFTNTELNEWIKGQPQQSADAAYKKYKSHAQCDRIKQLGFRELWKAVRGTRLGRPSKKS